MKSPARTIGLSTLPSSNETETYLPMPPAVREQVVDLLAKILVLDYELFQGVIVPKVIVTPVFNHKLRLVKPRK